jgi:hypothetical protein
LTNIRALFTTLLAINILALPALAQTQTLIQPEFFGLHENHMSSSGAPDVSFGAFRFWDTGTKWRDIEICDPALCQNPFDFTNFDNLVATLIADNNFKTNKAVFNLGWGTPDWACGTNCAIGPPSDLNSDGSGTNEDWKGWVTGIATHALNSGIHVKYWEIWNEFNNWNGTQYSEWSGTGPQLVRMAEDARCIIGGRGVIHTGPGSVQPCTLTGIDPTAVILSPSITPWTSNAPNKYKQGAQDYFNTLGAIDAAEEIAFHDYRGNNPPTPETFLATYITNIMSVLPSGNKTFISTEGGWGRDVNFSDPDAQESFVARQYLMTSTNGVQAHYWYSWDNLDWGTLWTSTGNAPCIPAALGVNQAGCAYEQIYKWMVGATVSACTEGGTDGTTWTCTFTRTNPAGYSAQAVWDIAPACLSNPGQTCNSYIRQPAMGWHRDLAGNLGQFITCCTVQIGLKPILLENKNW